MIQTLARNWWVLALCGVLHAAISAIYVTMQAADGPLTFSSWNGTVVFLGKLALVAGACAIAAGLSRAATGRSWLLVLDGVALGALGTVQYGLTRFRISFLTIALLVVVMAVSLGILEFELGRTLRRLRHVADAWLLAAAGAVSIGFALPFLAMGFRWIRIEPGAHPDLLWLGAFFGFTALSLLALSLRLRGKFPPAGMRQTAY